MTNHTLQNTRRNTCSTHFDYVIVGGGISAAFIALYLTKHGKNCLMIEAGESLNNWTYPRHEGDANSRLFWSGGIELNTDADLALLRPKVLGGGSIVNQALLDTFPESVWEDWRKRTNISWMNSEELHGYYKLAQDELACQEVPESSWNRNVGVFRDGHQKNGHGWARLKRAQGNCAYEQGSDCIECLSGCIRDSKQSMPITVLRKALATGLLTIASRSEVFYIAETSNFVSVTYRGERGESQSVRSSRAILAGGAVGNSVLLLRSGFSRQLPAIGTGFYVHPQDMIFGIYDEPIMAYKGGFQALKSDDNGFRQTGFKLENIFGPPASLAMLFPGTGVQHATLMQKINYMACLEVAIRDTNPGYIKLGIAQRPKIIKRLNDEDRKRRTAGIAAIENILQSTGAKELIHGELMIGLHLMGGCPIGSSVSHAVVDPSFKVWGTKNIFCADSSIFPAAPGINPSWTIMALSIRAAHEVLAQS